MTETYFVDQIQKILMTIVLHKFKKLFFGPFRAHFSCFWGKILFFEKIRLLRTIWNDFITLCQNLEKTNDPIPRERPDRRTKRRKDRPYFMGTLLPTTGGQIIIHDYQELHKMCSWYFMLKTWCIRKQRNNNNNNNKFK